MADSRSDKPVLVGVSNPNVVQQLVRTAGDVARLGSGTVRLVSVAVKPPDSPFGVFTDETIVSEFADSSHALLERATAPDGVTVERDVIPARSAARGLLAAVDEVDPAALVVGWHGKSRRSDAVLGTTVDRLVARAPCDLYVERIGREADGVDSVLLPIAGGPHVGAAARIAAAIAASNEARVHVISVDANDHEDTAAGYVDDGREELADVPGAEIPIETAIVEADDVIDAIVEESGDHDVIVMGATRKGSLRRKIAGSVPRAVVDRVDTTVILARAGDGIDGSIGRRGETVRRW